MVNIKVVLLLICVTAFSSMGCTIAYNKPDNMSDHGLLVATIVSTNIKSDFKNVEIFNEDITGNNYIPIENQHIFIQLKPGNYRLGAIGFGYAGPRFLLSLKFRIEAGRVTNLGSIVLCPENDDFSTGKIFLVDNSTEVRRNLKINYPKFYSKLKNVEFLKANHNYLTEQQIEALRFLLFEQIPDSMLAGHFVASKLGTIYRLRKDSTGEIANIEIIPTGTYEDIKIVAYKGGRFACLVPNPETKYKLFVGTGEVLVSKELPGQGEVYALKLYNNSGVVLYHESLGIFTSDDNGANWQSHTDYFTNLPADNSNPVGFHEGEKGIYLFKDSTILFRHHIQQKGFNRIPAPPNVLKIAWLNEIEDGLFLKSSKSSSSVWDLYFLPKNNSTWALKVLPLLDYDQMMKYEDICSDCYFIKEEDSKVFINDQEKCFESDDFGGNWRQVDFKICESIKN